MFRRQVTINIKDLDLQIGKLNQELILEEDDDKYNTIIEKIESLTELRCKLSESRVNGSLKPVVVSGLLGIASVVIVLKYEEADVITSKAFNMATSMFRGGR